MAVDNYARNMIMLMALSVLIRGDQEEWDAFEAKLMVGPPKQLPLQGRENAGYGDQGVVQDLIVRNTDNGQP